MAQCVEYKSAFHAACCQLRTVETSQRMRNKDSSSWRCDDCSEDSSSLTDDMAQSRKENSKRFAALEAAMTSGKESLDDVRTMVSGGSQKFCIKDGLNVEIRDVPLTLGENVYVAIAALVNASGVSYAKQDFSIAHRLPGRNNANFEISARRMACSGETGESEHNRSAAVMSSRHHVSEHLTPHNKSVLWMARSLGLHESCLSPEIRRRESGRGQPTMSAEQPRQYQPTKGKVKLVRWNLINTKDSCMYEE
ncbi:hypothetical protein J6590_077780 [Homalodisca vitripennis]|nr:hypothetical protein J6590_077780 [Homalodisca vitripennis]